MALPIQPHYGDPIPNNPFSSVEQPYIEGAYFPVIAGAGVTITLGGVIPTLTTSGGGGGTITSITAGTGLDGGTITTSGTISLADTTVVPGTYTHATVTVDQQGRITFIANGTVTNGTVTDITAGPGIIGGTITSSGTLSLDTACVISPTVLVNKGDLISATVAATPTALPVGANGQVLSADSSAATGLAWVPACVGTVTNVTATAPLSVTGTSTVTPNLTIAAASTSGVGAVQLNDTLTSTSTTEALTAAQGKNLQDQINALAITSNLTFAGTLDTASGNMLTVSSEGSTAGFAVGSPLPAASSTNDEYFVIVTTGAPSYSPPGGLAVETHKGDWFLSDGTAWEFLDVGFDPPYASTTTPGIVELSTVAETQAGTDATLAVTPASAAATYVPCSAFTALGDILVGAGAGSYSALPVGPNGQALIADTASPSGLSWTALTTGTVTSVATGTGLTGGPITTSGTIDLANTAVSPGSYTFTSLTVDQQGRLTAAANGVTPVLPSDYLAKGDVLVGDAPGSFSQLSAGTSGQVLSVDATAPTGLRWITLAPSGVSSVIGTSPITVDNTDSANPVVGIDAASTTQAGAVQLNDTVTSTSTTEAATANAVKTAYDLASAAVPCSAFTATGDILLGSGAGTYSALAVGIDGQIIVANSACSSGMEWVTCSALSLCGYTCSSSPLNTALGFQAGDSITSGTDNVAIGYNAGTNITTGSQNVVIGSNTSVSSNAVGVVAVGFCAGQAVTTGGCVTHIGWVSGRNSTGLNNTYVGALTGCAASNTSSCGTLLGFCAGSGITTGNGNTFLGFQSGRCVTTGGFNVAVGVATFQSAVSGACNVAIGCGALNGGITGNGSTAIGTRALSNSSGAGVNTAVGSEAGAFTTGTGNAYFGVNAGCAVTTGSCNTLIGRNSGTSITTGSCNTIVGSFAGSSALANSVVLADGAGTIRFQSNSTGAWSPNGVDFGSAGQVLTSQGSSSAPTWTTLIPVTGVTGTTPIAIDNTDPQNPVVEVNAASTTAPGVTQLNDTITSTSTTEAATANAVKQAYDAAVSSVQAVTGTTPIQVDSTNPQSPDVSVDSASTTSPGVVQLYDNTDSSSTALALTAAQGKSLQDQINALSGASNIVLAGTVDASTGLVASVTSSGTTAGYTVGSVLPAADATTENTYVIVTEPGTFTPPGGSPTVATRGDWFLVSETSPTVYDWTFLNVGFDAPPATTTAAGVVCLSTNALAQAGTDTTTALTPAAATSAFIPKTCISGKGALISGTAASTPTALAVGTDGFGLVADSSQASGLKWVALCQGTLTTVTVNAPLTVDNTDPAAPDLSVSTASTTAAGVVQLNDTVTSTSTTQGATANAVKQAYDAATSSVQSVTGTAPVQVDLTDPQNPDVAVDAASTTAAGVVQLNDTVTSTSTTEAATANAVKQAYDAATAAVQSVTGTGPIQVDATDPHNPDVSVDAASTTAAGVVQLNDTTTSTSTTEAATANALKTTYDLAAAAIPCSTLTAKGNIIVATAASTPTAIAVGTDGQVLTACSTAASGVCWVTPGTQPATPTTFGTIKGTVNNALLNTSVGCNALNLTATGNCNAAVGANALVAVTSGFRNTAMGANALCSVTGGIGNIGVGTGAAFRLTSGVDNVVMGVFAGNCLTTGNENVLVGNSSSANVAITGCRNIAIGYGSGNFSSGCNNVTIGPNVLLSTPALSCQLAIGFGSSCMWLTGDSTKAIKPGAGIIDCANSCGSAGQVLFSTGANSICWGAFAVPVLQPFVLGSTKGVLDVANNTGIGCGALSLVDTNTASSNVSMGSFSLTSLSVGNLNTAIGSCSMQDMTTGSFNTALGAAAGRCNLGECNTYIGTQTGQCRNSGDNNVALGFRADAVPTSGSNNVAIGPNVSVSLTTGSCQLAIGFASGCCWLTGISNRAIKPAAGIIDCANSLGAANQVLVSTGANSLRWCSVASAIAAPNFGSYYSTAIQTPLSTGFGQAMTITNTVASNGITLVGDSEFQLLSAGKYNIQFSAQLQTTTASLSNVEIWLVKNGTAVDQTNTRFTTKGSNEAAFAALNFVDVFASGDLISIYWATDDSNMTLAAGSSLFGGPDIPSVIITIVPVGA